MSGVIVPVQVELYPGTEPLGRGITITIQDEDLVALALSQGRILQGMVDGQLVQIRCARPGGYTPMAGATDAHGDPKRSGVVAFAPGSPDHENEYRRTVIREAVTYVAERGRGILTRLRTWPHGWWR